ncbi:hypothetical protein [Halorubrum sp. DTA46]|uniref:hypothetical protein n=1 Tax=Halorubrum sp. DTA46 TaxID=3402162 RepID=UPI003AAE4608
MPSESAVDSTADAIATTPEPPPTSRDAIEWGPVRYDRIRSLAAGASLVIVVAVAAFVVTLVGIAGGGLLSADLGALLGSVTPGGVFVAVGLLFAVAITLLPYALLHHRESTVDILSLYDGRLALSSFRPRWVAAGAALPIALGAVAPHWLVSGAFALIPLVWLLPMAAARSGAVYRLDPESMTLEREAVGAERVQTDDLGAVVRARRIDMPKIEATLFLLAYRGNAWYRSTPWALVPAALADEVDAALTDVLARSDGPDRASAAERIVLAVVGSSSLVVGLLIAVAAGEGAAGVALALFTAPFCLLFLALAARL